jgi:hypothetical protein
MGDLLVVDDDLKFPMGKPAHDAQISARRRLPGDSFSLDRIGLTSSLESL